MTSTPPFEMIGLDHVVIRCVDLDAMERFYCDVIGGTVDRHNKEFDLLQIRVGAHLVDLVTVDGKLGRKGGAAPGEEGLNMDHFAIRIEPFDEAALRAHLDAHGVEITEAGPRYGAEGTGPSIYCLDPEGNTVELKGPVPTD
ncbi:MAG: VOC family protein [Alphaproteobacteria bacterium]|nr:VOC family protein [Alphaproteobacteria bacterium]